MKYIVTKVYKEAESDNEDGIITVYDNRLLDVDKTYKALLIDEDNSTLERINILSEVYVQTVTSLSNNQRTSENNSLTEDDIEINTVHLLKQVANFLGYLTNCSSMQNQEGMQDYDKQELSNRLDKIKGLLKN